MDQINIEQIKKTVIDFTSDKKIKLNKLVLFGSYASGKFNIDSDIDLIIISESYRNKQYSDRIMNSLGIIKLLVKNTKMPVDVLYYSDEEWENSSSIMIRESEQNGKVLYSN